MSSSYPVSILYLKRDTDLRSAQKRGVERGSFGVQPSSSSLSCLPYHSTHQGDADSAVDRLWQKKKADIRQQ